MFCQAIVNDIIAERIRKIEANQNMAFSKFTRKGGMCRFGLGMQSTQKFDVFPRDPHPDLMVILRFWDLMPSETCLPHTCPSMSRKVASGSPEGWRSVISHRSKAFLDIMDCHG